ncbi:MAG: glycine cleavage T C-terminal barrel domain-containing protein [Bacteroidota bacterium]
MLQTLTDTRLDDINDTTSPLEAGLGWITKLTKDFNGSAIIKAQKDIGVKKKLIGFRMTEKGIPRHHYPILDAAGNKIGHVTSGTISPVLGTGIGLGYVEVDHAVAGTEIRIEVRGQGLKAVVHKLPLIG